MNCSGALAPPKLPSCSPNPIYLYTEIHNRTPVNFLHIMFHWQLRKWHRQKTCQICCWFVYCHGGSLYRTYGFCFILLRYVFSLKHTWFGSHVKNKSWFSKLAIVVQFSLSPKITIFEKYLGASDSASMSSVCISLIKVTSCHIANPITMSGGQIIKQISGLHHSLENERLQACCCVVFGARGMQGPIRDGALTFGTRPEKQGIFLLLLMVVGWYIY